ncbi:MAG: 4Fe-4S binding protein [bacterium]
MKQNKWKIARRAVQITVVLVLFSPALGFRFFHGTLISAEVFGLPLTDPLAALDYFLATRNLYLSLTVGAILVLVFYFLVGGRVFCGWVCPMFLFAEYAEKLHKRIAVFNYQPKPAQKYWLLVFVLLLSLLTSRPIFELFSPIGIVSQNIALGLDYPRAVFGSELALESGGAFGNEKEVILNPQTERWRFLFNSSLWIVLTILLIDLFVAKNWWCKFTCPVGALYSLVGRQSPVKVQIDHQACDNCGECFAVCFVSEVLQAPVQGKSRWVMEGICSNCFNCVDACPQNALNPGLKIK